MILAFPPRFIGLIVEDAKLCYVMFRIEQQFYENKLKDVEANQEEVDRLGAKFERLTRQLVDKHHELFTNRERAKLKQIVHAKQMSIWFVTDQLKKLRLAVDVYDKTKHQLLEPAEKILIDAGYNIQRMNTMVMKIAPGDDVMDKILAMQKGEGKKIRDVSNTGSLFAWNLEASVKGGLYEVAARLFHDAIIIIDQALGKNGISTINLPR